MQIVAEGYYGTVYANGWFTCKCCMTSSLAGTVHRVTCNHFLNGMLPRRVGESLEIIPE